MEMPETGLKFLTVVFMSAILLAVFIKRRYGPVGKKLIEWMGPRWTHIIKVGSIATLVLWLIFWVAVSPEHRAELKKFYEENTPWAVR